MAETQQNQTVNQTVIGTDTYIKGEMTFEGSARLLGTFEGKISAKGELHVADGASCKASVDAAQVVIDGVVEGNVTARERVELTARAKMKGDLAAGKLLVAEGATFTGHVSVGPEAGKAPTQQHQHAGLPEPKNGVHASHARTESRLEAVVRR